MKILLIDDHVLIRQAMQGVLRKLKRDAVVLEATNSAEAMARLAENPDAELILLDLTLPDRDGFAVLTDLRERYVDAAIVVLSAEQNPETVRRALELGARGYIPKSAKADVIINALRLVISGGIYIPPEILSGGLSSLPQARYAAADNALASPQAAGLTERQIQVLALIMQGKNNKTICRLLDLAEPTVKNHVTAILRALDVSSRTEAVITVNKLGWKIPEPAKS
ncbi:MAG TPA: response regulator transcription factor [Xanthobacteraceae bacterium]|jgi:DNA-binding NarL/FixJ family response regulator|nr:response regulator transcription factor [Xanthobacteraceae bacterium]